ncbi:MAG: cardiolipin synthase [Firmicutes bacterium]|nr:cardiolipin synthase [Bacillota bacterium]
MKKILSLLFHRVTIIAIAILAQLFALVLMIGRFSDYVPQFYGFFTLLSAVVVILIATGREKTAYKIAWIIPITLFPIFGGIFYIMLGKPRTNRRMQRKMHKLKSLGQRSLPSSAPIIHRLALIDAQAANQARYIQNHGPFPVYEHSESHFFPLGELAFESMLEELAKAERYIFLEYFIIEEGIMWNRILEILVEKAKAGVDVRLIYDDVGCLFKLPYGYDKQLEALGIKTERFHPLTPKLSATLNYRNHRKLLIIDGHTGFTGGINLADEYINAYEKLGHWKDSAFLIKGEPVWSLTNMFLAMWEYLRDETSPLENFKPQNPPVQGTKTGYIQPFGDNPLDGETVSETVYLNLISRARSYVYITTPYLILDSEMLTALCTAAKSGVDVRIITPYIPDKPIVHAVTRSYYHLLVTSGVRIYEYTPGFMHSKTIVADDEVAVVGSINLDYRSLYLAFENGVWMYQTPSVLEILDDFLETLAVCQEITGKRYADVGTIRRFSWSLLRLLAPLF